MLKTQNLMLKIMKNLYQERYVVYKVNAERMEENVENTKVDASIKENIETQNYTFMRGECLLPQG